MKDSDLFKLFAKANHQCGYHEHAKQLEDTATVYEAGEIIRESEKEK